MVKRFVNSGDRGLHWVCFLIRCYIRKPDCVGKIRAEVLWRLAVLHLSSAHVGVRGRVICVNLTFYCFPFMTFKALALFSLNRQSEK